MAGGVPQAARAIARTWVTFTVLRKATAMPALVQRDIEDFRAVVYLSDAITILPALGACSVDAVATDPP